MLPDHLHANGQPVRIEPAGQRERGQPRKIDRDGVNVRQIHLQWILGFFSHLKSRGWRRRGDDGVNTLERLLKVHLDQGGQWLGLEIIVDIITEHKYRSTTSV